MALSSLLCENVSFEIQSRDNNSSPKRVLGVTGFFVVDQKISELYNNTLNVSINCP